MSRDRMGLAAKVLAVAAAYAVSAWVGIEIGAHDELVTAVWPPTGIAVTALVLGGRRLWPGVALGALATELWAGMPLPIAAGMAVGNTLGPLCAALLLERVDFRPALDGVRHVLSLIGAGLVAMTISASGGTAFLTLNGGIPGRSTFGTWLLWWVGDVMGVVLIAPFALALLSGRLRTDLIARRTEAAAMLVAAGTGSWVLWQSGLPIRHLALAFAIWGAMRFGPSGAAVATLVISGTGIAYVVSVPGTTARDLILVQGLNAMIAVASLSLAGLMRERDRAAADLRKLANVLERRVRERTSDVASAKERLEQAQRLAHVGSFYWDAKTNQNSWTDELYRIHHLDPAEPAPSPDRSLAFIHPADRPQFNETIECALSEGRPVGHVYRAILEDGTHKWLHTHVEPDINSEGRMVGVRGACQDVTEAMRAKEAMRNALERERSASDHLRRLDTAKNSFLSAVSHELRTPLTAILGYSEMLTQPEVLTDAQETASMLQRLRSSASRLSELLSDLLDIDRLHRGIVEPRRRRVALRDLVARGVGSLNLGAHPLSVSVDESFVSVDPAQTERIIENLVANAVKYTPAGSRIEVEAKAVEGGGVLLVVSDSGPGIPHSERQAIFEPFHRSDPGTFTQGTGIGLALVDRFARLHGGRAWVTDVDGGGSAFHVILPGRLPPHPELAERSVA